MFRRYQKISQRIVKHIVKHSNGEMLRNVACVACVAGRNVEISRHIVNSVYSHVVKHIGRQVVKCFISLKTLGRHIGCHLCRDETRHTDVCGFIHSQSFSTTNSISLERSSLSLLIRYYTQCPKPSNTLSSLEADPRSPKPICCYRYPTSKIPQPNSRGPNQIT